MTGLCKIDAGKFVCSYFGIEKVHKAFMLIACRHLFIGVQAFLPNNHELASRLVCEQQKSKFFSFHNIQPDVVH